MVQVKATATGYYGSQVRVPDTESAEFVLKDRKDFSPKWMEPIGWKPGKDALDHDGDGKPGGAKNTGTGLAAMTVDQLKEYAAENGVDLGDAKKKDDIIAAIYQAFEFTLLTDEEKIAKAKEISGRTDDISVEDAEGIITAANNADI